MPANYEKPVYQTNIDKYKSNRDKLKEAEKKAPPRPRPTDSDHTKVRLPKEKPQ